MLSGADAERARELAAGMPAMCRAADSDDRSSAVILTGALDALTDAAARARLAGQPLLPARRGRRLARIPVAERWIVALTSAGGQVEVTTTEDEQEAAELAAQLDAWHSAAQLPVGPVRTCFRLVEPELGEEEAGLGAAKNSADASDSVSPASPLIVRTLSSVPTPPTSRLSTSMLRTSASDRVIAFA